MNEYEKYWKKVDGEFRINWERIVLIYSKFSCWLPRIWKWFSVDEKIVTNESHEIWHVRWKEANKESKENT